MVRCYARGLLSADAVLLLPACSHTPARRYRYGDSDFSLVWRVAWDDDFLYLAIDVTDDTFIVGEHCWECGVQVAFEVAGSAAGAAAGVLQDKRSDDPAISREIDMSMGLKQKQTQCRSPNADTRKVDGVDTECCVSYSTKVSGAGEWGLQLTKAAVLRNENNRHTT